MFFGRCSTGSVREPTPLLSEAPSCFITSVDDRILLGGEMRPEPPSGSSVRPYTVDVPGGSVPGVGWSIRLDADCAKTEPAPSSVKSVSAGMSVRSKG